jgi:formylmethanofuran dehydrogenase subunit C
MIVLTPIKQFPFPVMAECINPDVFQGKSLTEIAELPVWEGNRKKKLGDLFKIEEDPTETPNITLNGDFSEVRRVGMDMKNGEILVNGNVGMHLGEKMSGGKITVQGNSSGWTGSEMKGGLIEIMGNAGDYLASPYRGSSVGMRNGKIIVHGNVGSDVAVFLKGGIIKVHGNAGSFLGFRMHGGTVHIEKNIGNRAGACMTGGKIVVSGVLEEMLPTFTIAGVKAKVKIDENDKANGPFYIFLGDLAENGKGKLYVSIDGNPYLSIYEKFL